MGGGGEGDDVWEASVSRTESGIRRRIHIWQVGKCSECSKFTFFTIVFFWVGG